MKYNEELDIAQRRSFLLVRDLEVIDVNDEACRLLKFSKEDMLGKSINDISSMLRCSFNLNADCFDSTKSFFIFNKLYEPIEVVIEIDKLNEKDIIYFIEKVPNSKIEDKMFLFDHLFKGKDFGMAVFSVPNITLLKANQVWLDFLDKPFNKKERTVGRKISEFIKGWTGSASEDIWRKVLKAGETFHIDEYEFPFERGITYWDASLIPIFENGEMKYVVEMTKDITEKVMQRKIIEEQIRIIDSQKKQLENIFENIEDMVFVTDKEGNYQYVHNILQKFFVNSKTKTPDNLYQALEFFDLDRRKLPLDELPSKKVSRGEKFKNLKLIVKSKDREMYINITGTPIYYENGDFQMGILVCHDVTEDVLKSRIIEEQKEKLNAIISNISDGLVMLDMNMNSTILNDAARNFFYKPETIKKVGDPQRLTTYYDINGDIVPIEKLPGVRALKGEKVEGMRIIAKRPDKILHVDISGSPIYNSKRELVGSVFSVRYLDDSVKYEEMLKQQRDELQQVLKMKEDFFSYMSHEFKTPLTVMISTIQLIKLVYKNEITEKVMQYINKLNQSALQQLRLVNNLLDITRGESGYLRVNQSNLDIVSITKVIGDSVTTFATRKNIQIKFQTNISELIVAIDDEKYERILLNLLSNAIKFTPEGKSIYIQLDASDDKILISIGDEGVGIPEDKVEVIFNRFGQVNSDLTRHGEGTGIGLCLVKVLVEALNGDIKVESAEGEGSTFIITLPILTIKEDSTNLSGELLDNRLVQSMDIEFSNIYFE